MTQETIIQTQDINKSFLGEPALTDIDISIQQHDFTLINGPSGSGKTTLLNILSGITRPESGSAIVQGEDITQLSNEELTQYRAQNGLAFQLSGLIGGLTARQNIMHPQTLKETPFDPEWAVDLSDRLGVTSILDKKAKKLSGGQALRVSLVRSLVTKPEILFADEPSSALDTDSKEDVHELLKELTDANELTVVMVSHDEISQNYADSVIQIRDGRVNIDTQK